MNEKGRIKIKEGKKKDVMNKKRIKKKEIKKKERMNE